MIKWIGSILINFAVIFPLVCGADTSIVGTWVLTYVAPQDVENTIPGGITNTKMYFTHDGKLFSLRPDAISIANFTPTDYTFDGKQLKVTFPGGQARVMTVTFPDTETMIITQKYESQRTFKRIIGFDKKLEPMSLQLVNDNSSSPAATAYDVRDYSKLPTIERLQGVWEVIAYENVLRNQAPPYGFFNDIWTIKKEAVSISRRAPPTSDSLPLTFVDGLLTSSGIGLGGPVGSKLLWNASFNEWGNLVLDSTYCRLILKLVSKDTTNVPAVPLKIVLLSVKQ
ncbi:hypothetical protein Q9292_10155 [Methylophilus sp. VKM B-3414]|uniref:hypothetical protein n=1 Tax=unclassified Methylophilus TaxID=2630143 RepID=UPI00188DC783|nr:MULTISPECIES: hypothetical protein [unclassified Methylophilus]MBF5038736.1 hypothetical protein [Methylophilus sp. 13]MDT7849972.1 hypothetical protein [Methylophilus sp. VKM B-3414]